MDRYEQFNPYNKESVRKARTAASILKKQYGSTKGIVHIFYANNHGMLELDVMCLDDKYADEAEQAIPEYFNDFPVRIISPVWSTGELCNEYRDEINSFGIILFSSKKVKKRDAFFRMVIEKEKQKWNQMDSLERREFVDSIFNECGKDQCNCYMNWREEDF